MGVCTPGLHTQKGHFSDLGVCPHPHTPPLDPSLQKHLHFDPKQFAKRTKTKSLKFSLLFSVKV